MKYTLAQSTGLSESHLCLHDDVHLMHQETVPAWQALCEGASKAGFTLSIASSYRSFDRQLSIWNRKFCGQLPIKDDNHNTLDTANFSALEKLHAILRFSALPGASRHHWGCDFDIYDKNQLADQASLKLEAWEYQSNGPFAQLTKWLDNNIAQFNFFKPYQLDNGGIASEPWHISHRPVALKYQQLLSQQQLASCISQANIEGKAEILANLEEIYQCYVLNQGTQHVD